MTVPKTIELSEYKTLLLQRDELDPVLGEMLHLRYDGQVEVVPPSFKNDNQWELTSQGWVGYIPLSSALGISMTPKVPIRNLFGMLEYAYRLKSFEFLPDLFESDSLDDYYQRLANVLVKKILLRNRQGLYKEYLGRDERLPLVRGRLNLTDVMRRPWEVRHECHFHEHSADLDENRILAWTLNLILRTGVCSDNKTLANVRKAYRELIGKVGLQEYAPAEAIGRFYNRLNSDYQPMHALCRFFLEHAGPRHDLGDRTMLPFLVNMGRLFELFVYEWMAQHLHEYLPTTYQVDFQQKINVDSHGYVHFDVDLVILDSESGITKCVLDTKYKVVDKPAAGDVGQVVSYAAGKRCSRAILVYPKSVDYVGGFVGDILVGTASFSLDGDLEEAGHAFLQELDLVAPEVSDTSTIYPPPTGQQASPVPVPS